VRSSARQIIKDLTDEPRPARSKELRGRPGVYRVWLAGRWRIVYAIDDEDQLVIVLRIRRKDQIDYDSI
jgi:mRNA-degrading endonuclease RelE of RelBE toxin-antitoxin system